MTESASTPRLRTTFAIYLALVAATPLVGPREIASGLGHLLGIAGFACVTLACLGRIWCSLFIAGHKDETLVTSGPYAYCRHPLYSFSIVGALGLGLASKSLLLGALVVLFVAGLLTYAASCEEQFLEDAFPEEFKAYVAATPNMWWPAPRKKPLPVQLDVRPAVFWKSFLDAGSFFLLWLLVALAAEYRTIPAF
jgi:protein-S-isoprenylcysteine O-methyltransferase Ste14